MIRFNRLAHQWSRQDLEVMRVLSALHVRGPMSVTGLAAELRLPPERVRELVRRLERDGEIAATRYRRYRLCPSS